MAKMLRRGVSGSLPMVVVWCLVLVSPADSVLAQPALRPPMTSESRERLFQELAKDVAALERRGNLLKKVVRLVTPTVAHIEVEKSERSDITYRSQPVEEAGSGVVILHNKKFYIITNRHVIRNAVLEDINIYMSDGRLLHPTVAWADPGTDVAVLALDEGKLFPARLGNSDKVEIGDFVLAFGSPFGLSHSVTYGIISAKGRRDLQLGVDGVQFQDFMQTDAAINPGNSGGPLLNLRGEVIGINTAIASSGGGNEGIGFTIPINMAVNIARQLIQRGNVERAFLGVLLDSEFRAETALEMGLPRAGGARVKDVTPNSPAEAAKLQAGDVIVQFNAVRIEDDNHLINKVSLTPVGEEVNILLFRDGKSMTLKVRVGNRNDYR